MDGSVGVGGAVETGGASSGGGGVETGGVLATGGIVESGGVLETGGIVQTGGIPATGGVIVTGGISATGGIFQTGGVTFTGGIPTQTTEPDAGVSPCASSGKSDSDICWYYASPGVSCTQACSTFGGVAKKTSSHVGTTAQGGSADRCKKLFKLFGVDAKVQSGTRSDRRGLGCHMVPGSSGPVYWWLSSPNFDENASLADVSLMCGCAR